MNTVTVPQATLPDTRVSSDTQIVNMLERVVRDLTIDPARVREFMELHDRAVTRLAETEFNGAMADAQAKITKVATDSVNSQTRSRYASYAAMDEAIRPIYSEHGFALSFDTAEGAPEGCIRIVCDVSKGSRTKRYHIDMPADGKGARGNDVMTKTHATGSAVTYGRRYLLGMIFNVAVGEADDDGNGAGKRMTARERNELIKDDPEACERVSEEYGEREGGRMIKSMRPDDIVIYGETEVTSKKQFLLTTRERIRTATDGQALADWWNSEEQKQARQDFELTRPEFSSLKDFITARLKALKDGAA